MISEKQYYKLNTHACKNMMYVKNKYEKNTKLIRKKINYEKK